MCYTCSPACDNCMPKMVECPKCGHIELLGRNECSECGCPITDEMREAARAQWQSGRRFGTPAGPPRRNLVVERMRAQGIEVEPVGQHNAEQGNVTEAPASDPKQ